MHINGIVYLGIKTDKFDELVTFYGKTLGIHRDHVEPGFATFRMPNGDKVEIYGPNDPNAPNHKYFTTGPVAGFEVQDIAAARAELEAKGIAFLGPIHGRPEGSQWAHFRGPDGTVYEIKQRNTATNRRHAAL